MFSFLLLFFLSSCRFLKSYPITITYEVSINNPSKITFIDSDNKEQTINNITNWNYSFEYIIYSDQYSQYIFIDQNFHICILNDFIPIIGIGKIIISYEGDIYKNITNIDSNTCNCSYCIQTPNKFLKHNF